MRRLYVAGASVEVDMIAGYVAQLRDRGWEITFDWTRDVLEKRAAGIPDRDISNLERFELATKDIKGVRVADMLWFLVPPPGRSAGAWVELGTAIAMTKPILVSGEWRNSIFTSLANVTFDSHNDALAYLGNAWSTT